MVPFYYRNAVHGTLPATQYLLDFVDVRVGQKSNSKSYILFYIHSFIYVFNSYF